ncbi:hypothetical protein JS531_08120 [Bifidobacterium sp. CP2]|uniref:DUF3592 domain-containing protein n=1 Tax=Bifidobacterium sp. CP2 TaxID=2809025 RepID=UPI001BDCB1BB|nr:DUF3592 domain-containing protein [Bifidobacterium sp. CP2]MBT1181916.1 hypothetical protein [Bifidobacterium sp. CP2]
MSRDITWRQALLIASAPGVPGLILLVVGIALAVYAKRTAARCTAVTTGVVTDYRFFGNGDNNDGIAPLVSYQVDGRTYTVMRRFRGVSSLSIRAPWLPDGEAQLWVTPDDTLHVRAKGGRSINYGRAASRLWPLGSPMQVHYDPDKPWRAYAEVRHAGAATTLAVIFIAVGANLLFLLAPALFFLLP